MDSQNEVTGKLYNYGVHVSYHLSLKLYRKAFIQKMKQGRDQNRTREIRLSGIAGRPAETWTMVRAKRARKAEKLKQPSLCLRLRAPHFYPD